jgi:hypothetical protein
VLSQRVKTEKKNFQCTHTFMYTSILRRCTSAAAAASGSVPAIRENLTEREEKSVVRTFHRDMRERDIYTTLT